MSAVHPDEAVVDEPTVRRLVDAQFPRWSALPLTAAGDGTDNLMFRLGAELVVRLPRTPGTAADVEKEARWLPYLAPRLPLPIPQPVATGRPGAGYPFPWAVYRWLDGVELAPDAVADPERLGLDLARFVAALHDVDLAGARREPPLVHYRGGDLHDLAATTADNLAACRTLPGLELDVDGLGAVWADALAVDEPTRPDVWMHTDLKPSNLLVREGRLAGVVDFGGLSVGEPTAEHAPTWDLPAPARLAYADALELTLPTRVRARGWALAVAVVGVPYYWTTRPAFAAECLRRLRLVLAAEGGV